MSSAALRHRDIVYRPPVKRSRPATRRPSAEEMNKASRRKWSLILTGIILVSLVLIRVMASATVERRSFIIARCEQELSRSLADLDTMQANISVLESPARVRSYAIKRLGMITPASVTYMSMDDVLAGPGPYGEGEVLAGLGDRHETAKN